MRSLLKISTLLVFAGLVSSAWATPFYDQSGDKNVHMDQNESHSWAFNLDSDTVYETSSKAKRTYIDANDTITDADLSLKLSDDCSDWWWNGEEFANVLLNGQTFKTHIDASDDHSYDVLAKLIQHTLTVTIKATEGDFDVDSVSLAGCYTANRNNEPQPVPEPATLTLLGLGLSGLGLIRRRRKA